MCHVRNPGRELLLGVLLLGQVALRSSEPDAKFPIWFVSWQHTGHIKGLCPIALELQQRGWDVRVAVHEEVLPVVASGLTTVNVGALPWSWSEELEFRAALWDPTRHPAESESANPDDFKAELSERYFLGSQTSLFEGLQSRLDELPETLRPGLLVVDVASVGAMDFAEKLSLPYVVVSPWPLGPTMQSVADPDRFSHAWMPSELFVFLQSARQQGFGDRLKRAAFNVALPRFMEYAGFHKPRRELRRKLGLSIDIELLEPPRWAPKFERPLIVVLSHWGLDRSRPLPPNVALVGPVENYAARALDSVGKLPKNVRSWMEESKDTIVYVSFGTNVKAAAHLLRTLTAGMAMMEKKGTRFLWDIAEADLDAALIEKPDDEDAQQDEESENAGAALESIPANILLAPKVSQMAVLGSGRIAAFVSHCGLNSVHEAMYFGVPIIGIPFLGDQLVSARLLAEVGAGASLPTPRLTADLFESTVASIAGVNNKRASEIATRLGKLGMRAGGASAAADAIENVAEHGSGHFQTIRDTHPASDRTWDLWLTLVLLFAGVTAFVWLAWWAFIANSVVLPSDEAEPTSNVETKSKTANGNANVARKKKA